MSFGSTVELHLKPSLAVIQLFSSLHIAVLMALLLLNPTKLLMAISVLGVGLSWWFFRCNPALGFGARAIHRVIWHPDGSFTLATSSGRQVSATLQPSSIVTAVFMVLRFKISAGKAVDRVIFAKELDAETLRQLRGRLSVHRFSE